MARTCVAQGDYLGRIVEDIQMRAALQIESARNLVRDMVDQLPLIGGPE